MIYTKGPWRVVKTPLNEDGSGTQVVGADGTVICDDNAFYPAALDPKNANLLASAPELLEALEETAQALAFRATGDETEFADGILDCDTLFRKVRAAIAKAKGQRDER